MMSMRLAKGERVAWIDTRIETFSNFSYVDERFQAHPVMRRIFSLARRHHFRSVLVETIPESDCELLQEENEALRVLTNNRLEESKVTRLSFFRGAPDREQRPEDFIGSVVFKRDCFGGSKWDKVNTHVFEAVLPPLRQAGQNHFIHTCRTYQFSNSAGEFMARGVLYAQQNGMTSVCAHAALRTALATILREGDISYAKINELAGVDHRKWALRARKGLKTRQIVDVLKGLGVPFDRTVHEPSKGKVLISDYQRSIYGTIESGRPALVGFAMEDGPDKLAKEGLKTRKREPRHIIPVVGHSFDEDAWNAMAELEYFKPKKPADERKDEPPHYYPSSSWMTAFVVHDDNYGPYYSVRRDFLKQERFRISLGLKPVRPNVGVLEAEMLSQYSAMGMAQFYEDEGLQPTPDWFKRFCLITRGELLVIRAQIISREEYLVHLRDLLDRGGRRLEPHLIEQMAGLPDYFWMAELSATELFTSAMGKFGEVLIACNVRKTGPSPRFLMARLPGFVITIEPEATWPVLEGELPRPNLGWDRTRLEGHTPLYLRTPV